MNYLETGLPHTDLFKRKSEFVPPRYKPLCSLGRRYLGLEPVSKTELNSFINRLCQPKKPPQPQETLSRPPHASRPTGSGRFNGHKRMTGNQISSMVDRLTKRKTETKTNDSDTTKKKGKGGKKFHVQFKEEKPCDNEPEDDVDQEEAKEDVKEVVNSGNTDNMQKDATEVSDSKTQSEDLSSENRDEQEIEMRHDSAAYKKFIEEKMIEFMKAREEKEKEERDKAYLASLDRHDSGALSLANIIEATDRKPKRTTEEASYASLYYRGVKTEIARKFGNESSKRSSVQMGTQRPRSDSIKSAKTDLTPSPRKNSHVEDVQSKTIKLRSKTT